MNKINEKDYNDIYMNIFIKKLLEQHLKISNNKSNFMLGSNLHKKSIRIWETILSFENFKFICK
jgi:hypothetical protein